MNNDPALAIEILYRNYKGETRWRKIQPTRMWFGHPEYHPLDQWLLEAIDLKKKEVRNFALKDIAGTTVK